MANFATASKLELTQAGYVVMVLAPQRPRRSQLVLTQTKGSRVRTNRGNGGKLPSQV